LQGCAHDILYSTVVAQVDDFGALRLDQAAHDIDRCVMAVEQAGGGHEAKRRGVAAGVAVGKLLGDGVHGSIRITAESPDSTLARYRPCRSRGLAGLARHLWRAESGRTQLGCGASAVPLRREIIDPERPGKQESLPDRASQGFQRLELG